MPEHDTATLCVVENEAVADTTMAGHRTAERAAARELVEAERKYWDRLARADTDN
ncbi:hypothetical protein GCM10023169_15470 [Georgenia halophila]|uniref:Uncharacterized protein n=1 Tax=Georgenia halophila TaxID=620889 RepID=A0ABP8L3B0_9MICO